MSGLLSHRAIVSGVIVEPVRHYEDSKVIPGFDAYEDDLLIIDPGTKTITVKKLDVNPNDVYSRIQDAFDDPATLDLDIPMMAVDRWHYRMINGWRIANLHELSFPPVEVSYQIEQDGVWQEGVKRIASQEEEVFQEEDDVGMPPKRAGTNWI
jgi:hypothetical protein